ncbi:MAG: hypothetical protein EBT36_00010 [Betaproteobacteria bacterium]|nr:hypothetical protein [Betaproteobacteria bacterium]NBS37939.1 hypothetical protein [Betaproteobacteria bacterium]NBT69823.1 hypothetical protein [Betaproteobacteria bacterium]NBT80487.1 hypothetical protein [Betaproteobacteria bacterium]NCV14756.1 hypothetical protein [Betaproteobacteria bacterium]
MSTTVLLHSTCHGRFVFLQCSALSGFESVLKDRFNIRDFHDLLLMDGAMPLGVLDEAVDAWIATTHARPR